MASTVPEGQRSARPVRSERQESFPGSPLALPARPSGRSPLATLTGVQILGLGAYVPEQVVRNEDLAELGYDADWILQRSGIRERRRAAPSQATSDLALEAAWRCLDNSGVAADELDLILVATMSPDMPSPSTACLLQRRLGVAAGAMDIGAACAGFVFALVTGMQFVKSGCCRRVLVVGADAMSRITNPADAKTYPLFGDGAGAVVLGAGDARQGLLAYTLGSEGDPESLSQPAGGSREPLTGESLSRGRHYLQMDGRAVFRWAVRTICDSACDVLAHAGLEPSDLRLVVPHQANLRIIDAAAQNLALGRERMAVNLDRYGNTSAASIPLALDEAYRAGRFQAGDRLLLCGFGAGLAWGTAVLQW